MTGRIDMEAARCELDKPGAEAHWAGRWARPLLDHIDVLHRAVQRVVEGDVPHAGAYLRTILDEEVGL